MEGRTKVERVARQPFEIVEGGSYGLLGTLPGPAVVMVNPKFPENVASMIRNCAAFGIDTLVITGERIELPTGKKGRRLPRQERMREYRTVKVYQSDFPITLFKADVIPICVELLPTAMALPDLLFHPAKAVYVLGPEDGSVPAGLRALCHTFVRIPTLHCLNVAQAGGIVLYDRSIQRYRAGTEKLPELAEQRGMIDV